jgi:hypothetical protein
VFGDGLDRSTITLDLQTMAVLDPSIRIVVIDLGGRGRAISPGGFLSKRDLGYLSPASSAGGRRARLPTAAPSSELPVLVLVVIVQGSRRLRVLGLEGRNTVMVTLELGFGGIIEVKVLFSSKFDLARSGSSVSNTYLVGVTLDIAVRDFEVGFSLNVHGDALQTSGGIWVLALVLGE